MFKKVLLSLLTVFSACNYSVSNSARALGGDVFCTYVAAGTSVCYSRNRQKGFVCYADNGAEHGQAVCVEGLPAPAAESSEAIR